MKKSISKFKIEKKNGKWKANKVQKIMTLKIWIGNEFEKNYCNYLAHCFYEIPMPTLRLKIEVWMVKISNSNFK